MDETYNDTSADSPANPPAVLWTVWGAIFGTLGILGGIGFFLRESDTLSVPLTPEDLSVLIPIFSILAVAITAAVFAGAPMLAKHVNYQAYSIIRWALTEAIGTIGFVVFLLGASWNVFSAFLGWALLLAFYIRPTDDAHYQFLQLAGQTERNLRLRASHT